MLNNKEIKRLLQILGYASIGLFFFMAACSKKNESTHSHQNKMETVYMGDVSTLVNNALMEPFFDEKYLLKFNKQKVYFITQSSYVSIGENSKNNPTAMSRDAEQENEAEDKAGDYYAAMTLAYNPINKSLTIQPPNETGMFAKGLYIKTKSNSQILQMRKRYYSKREKRYIEESREMQILHVSVARDEQTFSLLLREGANNKLEALHAMYFSFTGSVKLPKKDLPFVYWNGEGVITAWPRKLGSPMRIGVCGEDVPEHGLREMQNSLNRWLSAIGQGAPEFKIEKRSAKTYRPFTDLNEQCIYVVNDFKSIADPDEQNLAKTTLVTNYSTGQILDADILIFIEEFKKIAPSPWLEKTELSALREWVYTHEMGHFLGLGHQFEKDIPSVMSYDPLRGAELSSYDKAAIQTLYR